MNKDQQKIKVYTPIEEMFDEYKKLRREIDKLEEDRKAVSKRILRRFKDRGFEAVDYGKYCFRIRQSSRYTYKKALLEELRAHKTTKKVSSEYIAMTQKVGNK